MRIINHSVAVSLTTMAVVVGLSRSTATQTPQQREPDFAQQVAQQAEDARLGRD